MKENKKKEFHKEKIILIVDDEEGILKTLVEALQESFENFIIKTAMDGNTGWKEFVKCKPDLVCLDLKLLSEIDGIDLLGMIREKNLKTPVIIMTGYGDSNVIVEVMKLGAYDVILKPFEVGRLINTVKNALHESYLYSESERLKNLVLWLSKEKEKLKEKIKVLNKKTKNDRLIERENTYRELLGSIAHRLKGEFQIIGSAIKEIRELTGNSREINEECELLERSIAYSHFTVNRMLYFIDITEPKIEFLSIQNVVNDLKQLIDPRLPSNIALQTTFTSYLKKRKVRTNHEFLMSTIHELVNNAINAMRNKGGIIEIDVKGEKEEIQIYVKDNGPGISKILQNELFKKQVQSKDGIGLGLFLSKRVVKNLGGRLKLVSSSKEGTTFLITLPDKSDN